MLQSPSQNHVLQLKSTTSIRDVSGTQAESDSNRARA